MHNTYVSTNKKNGGNEKIDEKIGGTDQNNTTL